MVGMVIVGVYTPIKTSYQGWMTITNIRVLIDPGTYPVIKWDLFLRGDQTSSKYMDEF